VNATEHRSPAISKRPLDRVTQLLLVQFLDDVLDALELWQSVEVTDTSWVDAVWSRRVAAWAGVELPLEVKRAHDAWSRHAALLSWQHEIVEALLSQPGVAVSDNASAGHRRSQRCISPGSQSLR